MILFYEYPKCSTCRAAKAELKSLGLEFEAIDIKLTPPSAEELKVWMEATGLELKKYFNTSGNSYRELGLKDKFDSLSLEQALNLLANDGMLIKRPLLIQDGKILQIGYRTKYENLGL
ncbi:arsenate reductase family protein [Streptococcus suis]|uniref:arsenate reductase family protein n=1 Tax=Streptococcus suis TaxID=1307 RepID=UPI001AD8942B|nr:arsenate reductase family protein [Streptococcus suis]MBO8083893.1 arsenate reductase family protein [Streptococcus suis]MCG9862271.1 arsenate reductase family protein [Streptococcus suis]MCK3877770.1 arsenate reductase family protein [Streptococcus suis]MCK3979462.1 arsenate reductase family protein [Streptococcus suis]MCK4016177.1 arsenate reductase family protein [Streptococcus suis]